MFVQTDRWKANLYSPLEWGHKNEIFSSPEDILQLHHKAVNQFNKIYSSKNWNKRKIGPLQKGDPPNPDYALGISKIKQYTYISCKSVGISNTCL